MIIQACLNGARPNNYHAALPVTVDEIVEASVKAVQAGAAELHVHPRNKQGKESLAAIDETVSALRNACPGTFVGVSTGDWIEQDPSRTLKCIEEWQVLPDYASVNLSEEDAPAVMDLLYWKGVGIEAGLATLDDAERFLVTPGFDRVLRILIEIEEQDITKADKIADDICSVLAASGLRKPVLLHGFDDTLWHFVRRARKEKFSTRVGLEDGNQMPDGSLARDNASMVLAAAKLYQAEFG